MSNKLTSVADCDYLEEDPPIRGQNYACVSFLSPEKILDDKDTFIFTKFTENFCKDVNEMFYNMKEKYPEDFIDRAYREAQEHDKKQFFKWLLSERKPWREYCKTNDDIPTFREWIKEYYE